MNTLKLFHQPCSKPSSFLASIAIVGWALLFSGCVAQKADLARVQKDLENQIKQLNQDKQELETIISKNRKEAEELQVQQDAAMKDLFRARAEIRQELKALREADLTTLTGDLEEADFRLTKLRQDLDAQTSQSDTRFQELETHAKEQNTQLESKLSTTQDQLTSLIQQIDQDSTTRNQQFSEFQTSLSSFKDSMAGLGNQLVQETERATQANTELSNQVDQKIAEIHTTGTSTDTRLSELETLLTSLDMEMQTQKTNIQDVSGSVGQIRVALEKSGTLVGGQVANLETSLSQLETHVNTLTEKLNADTQALRTYLEQDVKTSMNAMAETMADQQRPLLTRLDSAEHQLQGLTSETQGNIAQLQDLTQSVISLKEKQEFVGGLLGERGDKFMQESGRLNERLNVVESHQTDLVQQVEANTRQTTTHLDKVNSSLGSVARALETTSSTLAGRLDNQEQHITKLSNEIQALQQVKSDIENSLSTVQTTSQVSNEMRTALQKLNNRLQELEVHQSGLVGKLDADAQATNNHLTQVNDGIQSVATALEKVDQALRSKIETQDRKLNQALTTFQSNQASSDTAEANVEHLNQLTKTLNQLRDVVNTIGTKLGGRVDQHESRLAELAKRVNLLSSRATSKK
ncbi:MAG: hypothetical protein KC594_15690 [Nitrospira sp.]|nr:hypothetical protein [Nitrospira sp.]